MINVMFNIEQKSVLKKSFSERSFFKSTLMVPAYNEIPLTALWNARQVF